MADKARHAFGMLENIDAALAEGKIDAYDILFTKDANGKARIGWIDKAGKKVIVEAGENVINIDGESLPTTGEIGKIYIFKESGYIWNGSKFINLSQPTDVSELEAQIATKVDAQEVDTKLGQVAQDTVNTAKAYTDGKIEAAVNEHLLKKYEITNKPVGTLVDYGEKEIRVMCPANTVWEKQTVGETGNANMYYMGFKAYAPKGAVSFKEGDSGVIIDEMFTFEDDFAGTDKYGRNYSICWLALASYDESTDSWTYFGATSSAEKYVGWTYVVEWYDADGIIIESDSIRINLSNEDCYSTITPYYVNDIVKLAKEYTDIQVKEAVDGAIEVVEF